MKDNKTEIRGDTRVKPIDSRSNPIFRDLKSLLESSGLKQLNKFLLSGRKIVPEFIGAMKYANGIKLESVITFDRAPDIAVGGLQTLLLKKELFAELDTLGTHYPLLVGSIDVIESVDLEAPPKGLELVLALSDPQNLGAALRCAEAFEATKVILLAECAHPYLPKVLRSSSGSALRVPLAFGPSIKILSATAVKTLWALDRSDSSGVTQLAKLKPQKNMRLLIGQEGQGLPESIVSSQKISIEMKPGMDSLNAVSAASIALYSIRRHLDGDRVNG
jgi:RNA methyltransferase, TrmH family